MKLYVPKIDVYLAIANRRQELAVREELAVLTKMFENNERRMAHASTFSLSTIALMGLFLLVL